MLTIFVVDMSLNNDCASPRSVAQLGNFAPGGEL